MFLQRLSEYAQRLDLPPMLYAKTPVRYRFHLDREGNPSSPEPTDTAQPDDRSTRRGEAIVMPRVQRSSGIRPLLLSDQAAYTFGLVREDADPDREKGCHDAYLEQLQRCAEATGEEAVRAVLAFLTHDPLQRLSLPEDYDRSASITFDVSGVQPVDLASVQAFWVRENTAAEGEPGTSVMQCIVCGQRQLVLKRLKGKIKGIPGGQRSGTALISANANAYESYGLSASLIAPICGQCAERMTKALNNLLSDDAHHLAVGGSVFVFWTRDGTEIPVLQMLQAPSPEDVSALIASVWGKASPPVAENRFYAATLSASGGRAVVRGWIDTTVDQIQRNLARWFSRQRIVTPYGEPPVPLGIYALAGATVRELQDLPPTTVRGLLHSALQGAPLTAGVLQQALQRMRVPPRTRRGKRVEERVTRAQAALAKMALMSSAEDRRSAEHELQEDTMIELDDSNTSPAYLCGRLLAVLESAQRQAIPGANTTIVDRYYGTASTAPAVVFGTLLTGAQAHLGKLRRDRPGAHAGIQRDLEEVLAALPAFPRTLSLDQQALFALGYYHQRAHRRAHAREASTQGAEE